MSWLDFSSDAFIAAFFLYCASFISYAIAVGGKKWSNRKPAEHAARWGKIAFVLAAVGWLAHLTFFFTRWYGGGHIPTSNMYEFMTFLGMAIMFAFIVIYAIYRNMTVRGSTAYSAAAKHMAKNSRDDGCNGRGVLRDRIRCSARAADPRRRFYSYG